MKKLLKKTFVGGENVVFTYYLKNIINYLTPKYFFKCGINRVINSASKREDYDYILDRVDYYNKLKTREGLSSTSMKLKDFKLRFKKKNRSRYFFDTYEFVKYFSGNLCFDYIFGDIVKIPETPKILKSRPVSGSNENSVLLNLDKLRHFVFLNDKKPFRDKQDMAIFFSYIQNKPHRIDFMRKFYGSSFCICGDVQKGSQTPQWYREKISLWDHLNYKFILAIEGNDVATNLKWIMSSNSIAVMPKPKYETWFMEGRLIADYHYIEIKDDYSDLEEKLNYYTEHLDEAEVIVKNANNYIKQFKNKKREKIISYMVLERYLQNVN